MAQLIEDLRNIADVIRDAAPDLRAALSSATDEDSQSFDLTTEIPSMEYRSISDICHRLVFFGDILQLILASDAADDELVMFPRSTLQELSTGALRTARTLTKLLEDFANVAPDGTFSTIDTATLVVAAKNGQVIPLADRLKEIEQHMDGGLAAAYTLLPSIKSENFKEFRILARQHKEADEEAEGLKNELLQLRKTARAATTGAEKALEEAQQKLQEIGANVTEVDEIKTSAVQSNSQIQALIPSTEDAATKGDALKSRVAEIEPQLATFESRLAERDLHFTTGSAELDALQTRYTEAVTALSQIEEDAVRALGLGTADGLANTFAHTATSLERPLKYALRLYFVSIAILTASVVTAFANPFDFFRLPSLQPESIGNGWGMFSYMLTSISFRAAILLPGLFLVGFSRSRLRTLDSQKAEYEYRKTIAAALPGFKAQVEDAEAGEHAKAIVAAAFEQLLRSPREAESSVTKPSGLRGKLRSFMTGVMRDVADGND